MGQLILCWVKLWGFFSSVGKKVKFLGTVINLEVIKDIYLSFVLLLRFFFFPPLGNLPERDLSPPSGEFFPVQHHLFLLFHLLWEYSAKAKRQYESFTYFLYSNDFTLAVSHSCKSCIGFFLKTCCIKWP